MEPSGRYLSSLASMPRLQYGLTEDALSTTDEPAKQLAGRAIYPITLKLTADSMITVCIYPPVHLNDTSKSAGTTKKLMIMQDTQHQSAVVSVQLQHDEVRAGSLDMQNLL